MEDKKTVAEQRNYAVVNVQAAREIASGWLRDAELENAVELGLPEVDDRYHIWRIPLLARWGQHIIGELAVDARTSLLVTAKSTTPATLEARLLGREKTNPARRLHGSAPKVKTPYLLSDLRNTIAQGDAEQVLQTLPAESIDLIFTSPPYYNARPEYADYITYEAYLLKLRKIIHHARHVLAEGRFFVINISPVLIRRANRSESSRRIAVPFDVHRLFIEEDFDFIDDIIWEKPEGAGWATSRGRRFAADRNPLQYKPVPVTEYVLVYRKRTRKLIDWNIRNHPDAELVKASRVSDGYERTNIWRITPAHDKRHPAIFPPELVERVITYYSFKRDVVLDPFAGLGTVGRVAAQLDRRFVLIEKEQKYVDVMRAEAKRWLGPQAQQILTLNCPPIDATDTLL